MRPPLQKLLWRAPIRLTNITANRPHSIALSSCYQKSRSKRTLYFVSRLDNHGTRHFSLDVIPTVLLPPIVFSGLLLTLWAYKCFMMVVFQNKIIYMPNVPPFSRNEKVEDY